MRCCADCGESCEDGFIENGVRQLWNANKTYLIIECEGGERISNQTHGVMCHHPETRGILVELPVTEEIPHVGCCGGPLTLAEVVLVDTALEPFGLHVDMGRLDNAQDLVYGEAWLPVTGSATGILTWCNCD